MGGRQSSIESNEVETIGASFERALPRTGSPDEFRRLFLAHRSRPQYAMSAGRRRPDSTAYSRTRSLLSTFYMGSSDSGIGGSLEAEGGDRSTRSHLFGPSSLPNIHFGDAKCPVCSKTLSGDQMEAHLMSCLSRPYISYNEDRPVSDLGECVICFEEMTAGCTIARLPCLCVYHKECIDKWFSVNRCCPEHPL